MNDLRVVRSIGTGAGSRILHDIHDESEVCDIRGLLVLTELVLEGYGIDLLAVVFHLDNDVVDRAEDPVIELVTCLDDLLDLGYGLGGHEHTGEYGSFRIIVMGHYFFDDIFTESVHIKPLRL